MVVDQVGLVPVIVVVFVAGLAMGSGCGGSKTGPAAQAAPTAAADPVNDAPPPPPPLRKPPR